MNEVNLHVVVRRHERLGELVQALGGGGARVIGLVPEDQEHGPQRPRSNLASQSLPCPAAHPFDTSSTAYRPAPSLLYSVPSGPTATASTELHSLECSLERGGEAVRSGARRTGPNLRTTTG